MQQAPQVVLTKKCVLCLNPCSPVFLCFLLLMLLGTHLHKTAIRDRENGQWAAWAVKYHRSFTTPHKSAMWFSLWRCSELTAIASALAATPPVWYDIYPKRRLYMPVFALWIPCHTADPHWSCACHSPFSTLTFPPLLFLSPWTRILRLFCNSSFCLPGHFHCWFNKTCQ